MAELSFWYDDRGEEQALCEVVEALLTFADARLNGRARVHQGEEATLPFRGQADLARSEVVADSLADVLRLAQEDFTRVVEVSLRDVVDFVSDLSVEVIIDSLMSVEIAEAHPITILLPDDDLFDPGRAGREGDAWRETRELFRLIIEVTSPAYAGIFNEFTMPTPQALLDADDSLFREFWVAESLIGTAAIEEISALASGSERVHGGLVVRATDAAPGKRLVQALRGVAFNRQRMHGRLSE